MADHTDKDGQHAGKDLQSVLFVCLGNICRSPTAEGVFLQLLHDEAPDLAITVDSAGTADYHIGRPPDARAQRAARRRGIDLSALRARQVRPEDFTRFNLLLAMDHANLRDLRAMRPASATAELRLFMEYAGTGENAGTGSMLDVPDPYYGNASDFERVLDLSRTASEGLLASLKHRS